MIDNDGEIIKLVLIIFDNFHKFPLSSHFYNIECRLALSVALLCASKNGTIQMKLFGGESGKRNHAGPKVW